MSNINGTANGKSARDALIAGLRQLADWYEAHPDVPAPWYPELAHCVMSSDDDTGVAEVQTIANAAVVPTTVDEHGADACRMFDGLRFHVFYVRRDVVADWDALTSYRGAVHADEPVADLGDVLRWTAVQS
jgi:hypothetical protein